MRGMHPFEERPSDRVEVIRDRRTGGGPAGVAARLAAQLVDPWGPSRLRRWLHVTGARYGGTGRVRERAGRRPEGPGVGASDRSVPHVAMSFPRLPGGVSEGHGAPTDCGAADAAG
jgi:hypothetical protein